MISDTNFKHAFPNFPSNTTFKWPMKRIGDFVNVHYGKALHTQERIRGEIPVYGTNGITGWHNEPLVQGPSVVIGRVGAGPLGVYWCEGPFWVIDCGYFTSFREGEIIPKYFYYFLNYVGVNHLKDGTSKPTLNRNRLSDQLFPYPPLPSQRKIAVILSGYDDLIENNNRRIKILEEMAQNLYNEWFVKFRFPGHKNVKMVDSELGRIPAEWEVANLTDMVETQYGYTESASDRPVGPKLLRGTDINKQSFIDWDTVPYCPISSTNHNKFRLYQGDIVIIRMADPGKVGIVEKEIDAVFASYLVRLQISSAELSPYYLFFFLLSERYQGYITGASTGTTRKSASAGVLTSIDILVPPLEVRSWFESEVIPLRLMLNILLEKNSNLRRTRDLLLSRLISGELDVSELEIDIGEDAA